MNTPNLKKLAVGLLVMTAAFAVAPVSQAETPQAGTQRISVAFKYNPAAPAEKIYKDLRVAARTACEHKGATPIALRMHDKRCTDQLIDSGVAQFGRADIAELHKGRIALANR